MTITFLNVGYGEAILVECPDAGHPQGTFVMLIDGGSGEAEEFPPELPERAPLIKELERRGLAFDPDSAGTSADGKRRYLFLKDEIGGFAVQIIER